MSAPYASQPTDWLAEFPPARSLSLDPEAQRIYERAYAIGIDTESATEPPITFSTVLLALLTGEDETSRWFASQAGTNGPHVAEVRKEKGRADPELPSVTTGRPQTVRLSNDKQLLTASARSVLETAEAWANRVGGSDIGVRHLLASYVINPPAAHRLQMSKWGFEEVRWREVFYKWIAPRYTAEAWLDVRQRAAPAQSIAAFDDVKVKGEALAFPGDAQAMQVLDRAARLHGRGKDPWLRLHTVMFALADAARTDERVRAEVAPLWRAIASQEEAFFAALAKPLSGPEPGPEAPKFDALSLSPRVLSGLETARELAFASGKQASTVGVLHLAAALVSRRVDDDDELLALGLDAAALRQELIRHAVAAGHTADTWRDALGEEDATPTGRPVDINSDEPAAVIRADVEWKADPLGIRPDVHAFAALLASRSLEPPLSIGLFGPWGSGKTTFLKRLRLVVDQRAAEARKAKEAGSHYVGNVVHVEFNAWHFAEDALVSSLLDTIVRELHAFIKDSHPAIGKRLLDLRAKTVDSARRAADEAAARATTAREAVEQRAEAVVKSEAEARASAVGVGVALRMVWKGVVAATEVDPIVKKSGVLDQIGEAVQSAADLRQRVAGIRSRSGIVVGALGTWASLFFAALVLGVPPATAWIVHYAFALDGVPQALSTVAALVGPFLLWMRSAAGAAGKVEQAVNKVVADYEKKLQEDAVVQAAKEKLETATSAATEAATELAVAESALVAAQAAATAATLPAQVLTLTSTRLEDATYAKDLTTISIARGDLKTLSDILRDQATGGDAAAAGGDGAAATLRPVDRVILYIDDLDRCPPQQVVRVLQVVHMLLAFELFVVVVAVDARWVAESLRTNYRWIGADDSTRGDAGRVTPQDYLEKIFQISFWLEPMTAARAAAFLKSLARPARGVETRPGAEPASSGGAVGGTGRIDIRAIELDYLRALAGYVGPSPRRVKRLVNAYRLLKARLSDAQLAAFITDRGTDGGDKRSGPYQLVIGLLVIGTGAPGTGARILSDLGECDPRNTFEQVIGRYRERNLPDWTMAARVLETLMRTQRASNVAELRGWARRVSRFLLQGPQEVAAATDRDGG